MPDRQSGDGTITLRKLVRPANQILALPLHLFQKGLYHPGFLRPITRTKGKPFVPRVKNSHLPQGNLLKKEPRHASSQKCTTSLRPEKQPHHLFLLYLNFCRKGRTFYQRKQSQNLGLQKPD